MNNLSRPWRTPARALPLFFLLLLAACSGDAAPLTPMPPPTSGVAATPTTVSNSAVATATRGAATRTVSAATTASRTASATPGRVASATATRGTATQAANPAALGTTPTVVPTPTMESTPTLVPAPLLEPPPAPMPPPTTGPLPRVGPTPTVPGPPIPVLPTISVPTSAATVLPPATSGAPATSGGANPARPGRAVSNGNPLRVYMAGDSFAEWIGADLSAYGQRSGPVVTSTDGKISSGLANPAFFDWPARLTQALATNRPDVVVIVLGANDLNGVSSGAGYFANGTPGWFAEYGRRQGQIMDIVGQGGAQLYWLAQPPMRDPGQNAAALAVNQSAQAQITSRPWVHYVDTWTLFSDANGNYATTVIGAGGQPITARQGDGLHLSREGATLLAASAYAQIRRDWGLP